MPTLDTALNQAGTKRVTSTAIRLITLDDSTITKTLCGPPVEVGTGFANNSRITARC